MILLREDYNQRVICVDGSIPEDEPVFLLRAQDRLAPVMLQIYADMNDIAGGDNEISNMTRDHADQMKHWQRNKSGAKLPDLP